MFQWHQLFTGHERGQNLEDDDGQGNLTFAVHGVAESDMTEQLN